MPTFLAGFMLAQRKSYKTFIKSVDLILSLELPAVLSSMYIFFLFTPLVFKFCLIHTVVQDL